MLDDALPGSRVLSATGQNRINCALADNDAETNMRQGGRIRPKAAPLPASPPLP